MAYWHWEILSTPFMKTKRTRAEKLRLATQPVCRDANVYLSKSRLYGLQQAFRWLLICRPSSDLWGPEVLRQQQHQTPHIIGGLARLGDKTTTWFRQVPSILHVQGIGAISSRNQCQRRMVACSLRKNGHEFPAHRVHARWQHGPMASGGYEGCEGWHGQYCSVRRRQWRLRLQRRQWRLWIVHLGLGLRQRQQWCWLAGVCARRRPPCDGSGRDQLPWSQPLPSHHSGRSLSKGSSTAAAAAAAACDFYGPKAEPWLEKLGPTGPGQVIL